MTRRVHNQLAGRRVGGSAGWRAGGLAGSVIRRSADPLVRRVVGWRAAVAGWDFEWVVRTLAHLHRASNRVTPRRRRDLKRRETLQGEV